MAISILNAGPSTLVTEPSDLPYAIIRPTPVNGVVTLVDRAVNLVEPTVTQGAPHWTWSDDLAHGTPVYMNSTWGFVVDGVFGNIDELGRELVWNGQGDEYSDTITFWDDRSESDKTATRYYSYSSDVSSLSMPSGSYGLARDFMVRLVIPAGGLPVMLAWPAGVAYETEDGIYPDVSEAGTYLLAFTETGEDSGDSSSSSDSSDSSGPSIPRFALMCRKVQGVE